MLFLILSPCGLPHILSSSGQGNQGGGTLSLMFFRYFQSTGSFENILSFAVYYNKNLRIYHL